MAEFNDLDTRFHVQIARSSGNELTSTLTSAVRESVRPLILRALEAAEDWPATAAGSTLSTPSCCGCVRAGKGAEGGRSGRAAHPQPARHAGGREE
ncbi:hypothetical protein GCM10018966_071580 [Streptomyces yanii]